MNNSKDGVERSGRRRRSRRLFMQLAGGVGVGLAAGPSIAASQGDDKRENDGTDAAEESNGCPPTEIEPGLHRFVSDDGETDDRFGDSVAIDGDTAVVAPGILTDFEQTEFERFIHDPATAYAFTYDDGRWCQQAKLVADEGGSDEDDENYQSGSAVSLDGDTAIVGDVNYDGTDLNTGAAFVFTRDGDTWSQEAKLTAEDGQRHDRFGRAISLDGDTALVGAHLEDERGSRAGAAYAFTRDGDTWSQEAKLTAEDGASGDLFGLSVALDGDAALVSAPYKAENGNWTGAAYVFTRDGDTWSQEAKLLADDGAERDRFGRAVDLDGDTALLGAPYNNENSEDAGAAYVFARDGESWSQEAKLLAEGGAEREQFGWSIGLDGDRAVVGMWRAIRRGAPATGVAYLFTRDEGSWGQEATLLAPDGEDGDEFGRAVDLDDETILAGAPGSDEAGSTYAFDLARWEPTDPDDEDPSEEPTEIDSCTVITEPGEYELIDDLAPGELDQPACIVVDSDDVTLRGNGHTIDASDATHAEGNYSEGYNRPPCIAVHPYTNGLGEDNWNTVVEDVVVTGGHAGVAARLSSGGHYEGVRAADNDHGFLFETDGGLVRDCVVEDNDRGVTVTTVAGPRSRFRADLENCTIRSNGTGLWIDQEMDATAVQCRIVENSTGVLAVPFALETDQLPPTVALEECHICRNDDYGVHARTDPLAENVDDHEQEQEGVVLAVDNYWGAANGPSSFGDPTEPYVDPETGRPADGDGDAVSQSLESGVANVRFDPFFEQPLDDVGVRR